MSHESIANLARQIVLTAEAEHVKKLTQRVNKLGGEDSPEVWGAIEALDTEIERLRRDCPDEEEAICKLIEKREQRKKKK